MIGVYDYTVIATYLSLLLGLAGLYSAAQSEPLDAMLCLMLAGNLVINHYSSCITCIVGNCPSLYKS